MQKSSARQFVEAWKSNTTRTIAAINLAKEIDPKVKADKYETPFGYSYRFSDGSLARTEGKGRNFKIWAYS